MFNTLTRPGQGEPCSVALAVGVLRGLSESAHSGWMNFDLTAISGRIRAEAPPTGGGQEHKQT